MARLDHSFGAYRYFIVPNEQLSLFDEVEEKRKTAIQCFFSDLIQKKKQSWEINGRKYLLIFNCQLSDMVYICKFSMETKKTIFVESDFDIENIAEVDYPFIYVIIDTRRQIVLFELKTSAFSSLNVAKDKLKTCFEIIFSPHGFEVLFEEIVDSNTFWTFVNDSQGIYEVSMKLNSPNLFGGFNDTNDMLKDISKTYNNNQTMIRISANKPNLTNINQNNKALKDAVEYASGGGGEWTLTTSSKENIRKTYKSKHNIRKVAVKKIDTSGNKNELKEDVFAALNTVETVLIKGQKDETNG